MRKKIYVFMIICFIIALTGCIRKTTPNVQPSLNSESSTEAQETTKKDETKETTVVKTEDKTSEADIQPAPVVKLEVVLKQGDSGDKVSQLQKKLFSLGNDLTVDGIYGNETAEAVKKIQKSNNLEQTGNLDMKTDEIVKGMKDVRAYSPPQSAVAAPAPVEAPRGLSIIPDIQTNPGDSQQVIVVLAPSYGTINASFKTYEKINGLWQVANSGSAVTGKKGFSDNRQEGDLTSPTGKYGIPFLFGNAANPGVKLPYRKVQEGDYWVSNKIIEEYNVWMHYEGSDAKERLYDYEALWTQPLYKYAAVIDFNYGQGKIMGKGSGIFLHIAPYTGGGTLGCIGISETNLVKTLKWLDPAKKPIIIMGVKGHI